MPSAICVDNLGKKYTISHIRQDDSSLRELLSRGVARCGHRLLHPLSPAPAPARVSEEFWALQGVSFDIARGDRVGIIGRNGAGKSTLLKILSRITQPTTGSARVRGRVASLLEVGSGFHPELTGRENIFLNGAILGMSKGEIVKKFDEIVDFSEVETFLDTPVKRYSSGMYVRLAFAVAAHLEPEILIVDEVLAVGDAQFQKKCLGKMETVGSEGRTVLFVSHNMQAVRYLCNSAIVLREGKVACIDTPERAIDEYLRDGMVNEGGGDLAGRIAALPPDPAFRLVAIDLSQQGRGCDEVVENGQPLDLAIEYDVLQQTTGLRVYFDLCDEYGTILFRSFHDEQSDGIPVVHPGRYRSRATIPANLLGPSRYEIRVRASIFNVRACTSPEGVRIKLKVEQTGRYNKAYLGDTFRGKLAPTLSWENEAVTPLR
ncbi:ABC transporter ATP-binding protein [Geomonas anaerohicana]|uniref:ATP-binding cassette domain-containing protein n=1 Tax=Geomonas anaerohicana TaxID=2798583 RepID=A0ABS0YGI7_9BACT|nr:polysaccharide ABC transporter ATP-binding protein [Geomonas anaerohicana]MBJ6751451.1 ATP-binding cassette domain-containing protein [Geomonas anaerohicana]